MYSREHRATTSSKSHDTPAKNQFAPRPFVIQTQTKEVKPPQEKENNPSNASGNLQTGIAQDAAITRFTSGAKSIQDNWTKQTPQERAYALGESVNQELVKINSFACQIDETQDLGTNAGKFYWKYWTILINKVVVSAPTVNTDKMADILEIIYHEARHSEQWYRMAKMLAGKGKTAEQIVEAMEIPIYVAQAASEEPLKPLGEQARKPLSIEDIKQKEQELQEAQDWYNSVYGSNKQHRIETLTELKQTSDDYKQAADDLEVKIVELKPFDDAFDLAEQEYNNANNVDRSASLQKFQDFKAKWEQKQKEYEELKIIFEQRQKAKDEAFGKYKALPEEADAGVVGNKAASTYKESRNNVKQDL